MNQTRMFYAAHKQIADQNRHVIELIHDPVNPLTRDDLHKLADRFPERWGKYRNLLDHIHGMNQ